MKSYDELFALITQRGTHAVFGEPGEGYAVEQNAEELAYFLLVCQELGVESILEIGSGYKAGLARFLSEDMGWRVSSVDIKDYGHSFGGVTFLHPLDFEHGLTDEAFDLLLIDADHTYEGVNHDYEYYAPYATKVIAFHDIAGLRECQGVKQYWDEIAHEHPWGVYAPDPIKPGYHEIIAKSEQRGGIGYIVLAEVLNAAVLTIEKAIEARDEQAFVEAKQAKKSAPRKRTPAKKPVARAAKK